MTKIIPLLLGVLACVSCCGQLVNPDSVQLNTITTPLAFLIISPEQRSGDVVQNSSVESPITDSLSLQELPIPILLQALKIESLKQFTEMESNFYLREFTNGKEIFSIIQVWEVVDLQSGLNWEERACFMFHPDGTPFVRE